MKRVTCWAGLWMTVWVLSWTNAKGATIVAGPGDAGFRTAIAAAQEGAAPPPANLTPARFDEIKARLTLSDEELAWKNIHWRDGFFEGLLEAQAADKPLFYWIYEGDPRGYS